jgi:hypothetical protein
LEQVGLLLRAELLQQDLLRRQFLEHEHIALLTQAKSFVLRKKL